MAEARSGRSCTPHSLTKIRPGDNSPPPCRLGRAVRSAGGWAAEPGGRSLSCPMPRLPLPISGDRPMSVRLRRVSQFSGFLRRDFAKFCAKFLNFPVRPKHACFQMVSRKFLLPRRRFGPLAPLCRASCLRPSRPPPPSLLSPLDRIGTLVLNQH